MRADGLEERREVTLDERDRLRRAAARVLGSRPDVVAAYLHGSAARGEPARDLDVAVAFRGPEPGFAELDEIAAQLGSYADVPGLAIDLRALGSATPRFRANVLRDGEVLYESDREARLSLEVRFMIAWADFEPVWTRMRARMLSRWADG